MNIYIYLFVYLYNFVGITVSSAGEWDYKVLWHSNV